MIKFNWGVALIVFGLAAPPAALSAGGARLLAPLPPMGWNDWAHYQCHYTAETILSNARALVNSGLRAQGYDTVTIDDCWMEKDRDDHGNLQVDPQRFPHGMKPVADAVHALGLKFGIYEDAGYATCGGFAGSGEPNGGGSDHFVQDTKLFASWGVDYLKLDGCNVYVPQGDDKVSAYRRAYKAQSDALKTAGRPIVFSESAPAYFQGTPDWYDVLSWIGDYGELWREGSDIATFHANDPDRPRFHSVLWNYAYNLPLGRFQKPGNWNDADFIIGGDPGMSLAETRSQMALWSMMSAPLILSSDVEKLSHDAVSILGNKAVIAIDQDPLGRMATLVRRNSTTDVLLKHLSGGRYAVAALNRADTQGQVELNPADLGFRSDGKCRLDARDLWSGAEQRTASSLKGEIGAHDTAIWSVHPSRACGSASRTGTITRIVAGRHRDIGSYALCLTPEHVGACSGGPTETWTVTSTGALESHGNCLGVDGGKPVMQPCSGSSKGQHWRYTLAGELISGSNGECLTGGDADNTTQDLSVTSCGHNRFDQIWSLPN